MGKRIGDGGRARRIDGTAATSFLAQVREGASLPDAARVAGYSISGFYRLRARNPDFAAAWAEAMEVSAVPRWVAPGNRRRLQRKAVRRLRFDERRREVFLVHFTETCDAHAAAGAANVAPSTVYRCYQREPDFAAEWDRALETGYVRLEAEAVRARLAAMERMRGATGLDGELVAEFERVMKLLARYDRRRGQAGPRHVGRRHLERWTFAEAMEALDRKLAALGIKVVEIEGYEDEEQRDL